MKIIKYLFPIFCTALFAFCGCREDYRMPTMSRGSSLRHLSFKGIGGISTSRGFTINADQQEGSGKLVKTAQINFSSGSWDNSTNKPKLLLVVKSSKTSDNTVFWAKILDSKSYEYVKGSSPLIRINTEISYSNTESLSSQKLVIYAFDKSLDCTLIKPNGSNTEYEISLDFPSLEKTTNGKGYKLNTADKEDYKLIFSTELELETIKKNYDKRVNYHFEMNPFGVLLLFDLRNISSSPFHLPSNYLIRVKTNGFSFENVEIDCANDKVKHSTANYNIYEYSGNEDRHSYGWDSNGNIDYHNILDLSKAGLVEYTDIELLSDNSTELSASENNVLQRSNRSAIYALYVMPTTSEAINGTTNYNTLNITHPDNFGHSAKENFLFKHNKPIDFYRSMGTYRYLTLDVPSIFGSMSDIKDFNDKDNIDNNVGDSPKGKTKDFNDKDNIDNNVGDSPKGKTKDFNDKDNIDNNVGDSPKGKTKDFKNKGNLDNTVKKGPIGKMTNFKNKGEIKE